METVKPIEAAIKNKLWVLGDSSLAKDHLVRELAKSLVDQMGSNGAADVVLRLDADGLRRELSTMREREIQRLYALVLNDENPARRVMIDSVALPLVRAGKIEGVSVGQFSSMPDVGAAALPQVATVLRDAIARAVDGSNEQLTRTGDALLAISNVITEHESAGAKLRVLDGGSEMKRGGR